MSFTSTPMLPGQTWASGSSSAYAGASPITHTQSPIMTGTSVLGVKFDGGVVLAADTLASYGSMARFDDVQRLHAVGKSTCIAAGGDMSDFQALQHMLDSRIRSNQVNGDGHELLSSHIYEFLARTMYNRRSKMDPLWMSLLVGGVEDGEACVTDNHVGPGGSAYDEATHSFLGYVDLQGTTYTSPVLATGFGAHLALPLMRRYVESLPNGRLPTQAEAETLIEQSMRVLFYRDARSVNKYQTAIITKDAVEISKSKSVDTQWGFAEGLRGYGAQTQ